MGIVNKQQIDDGDSPKYDDNWPSGPPSTKSGVLFTKEDVERLVEMPIIDFSLYVTAFSYNPIIEGADTLERLEFLGDSVLGFLIAKYLYDNFPGVNEGILTRIRVRFVSGKFLSKLARDIGLSRFIIMNQKGLYRCWHNNASVIEDAFEALIGALYLDLGINAAKEFFMSVLSKHANLRDLLTDGNHKDRLTKHCRRLELAKPIYKTAFERNGFNSLFVVDVTVDGRKMSEGTGTTRKDAEQAAARSALLHMGIPDEFIQ
jgi:ribonuclease-3